jgi:N-acetylglucosamine-6-phosphate deacetylase
LLNISSYSQPKDGAHHLGVHLEGPYLNPNFAGAQPIFHIRNPIPEEYQHWIDTGEIRLMTVAPEQDGVLNLIEDGLDRGVKFSVGHSGSSFEQVKRAAGFGLNQATHTFNGMLGIHHRIPGTVGAVLTDDNIFAQLIVDGIHLHPEIVKLTIRAKGMDRVILITDAIRAAGLGDGRYELGGQDIHVEDGIARTSSGGLAGSTLSLDVALRNVMEFAEISISDAVALATINPAKAMGWDDHKGKLAVGADADVIVLDEDLKVRMTIISGKIVFRNL